jgi:GH25 family lysozyme M1 (1,4-beta-N-acetylmuramidase)
MIADLSHYQGTIDWAKAAPHLDFVILRASVGSNKDNKYNEYAENCRKYNVPYGTYHYVKSTNEKDIIKEADHFYDTASKEKPLFYVADMEYEPTMEAGYDKLAATFLTRLKERGAKRVFACCTHPVLSGPAIERIQNSAIEELLVLDTVPLTPEKQIDKIKVLSVAPVFADAIDRIYENVAVSPLFN